MSKSSTVRSIAAIAVAAIVAGLVVFSTVTRPEAEAASQVAAALYQSHANGKRSLMQRAKCGPYGWPYYDRSCEFDLRRPGNEARMVRIITLR